MTPTGRMWLSREFATWQRDPGLADLRDAAQLESSGPEFRNECAALWQSLNRGIARLQGANRNSTTQLHNRHVFTIGVTGFEPAASWSRINQCTTKAMGQRHVT